MWRALSIEVKDKPGLVYIRLETSGAELMGDKDVMLMKWTQVLAIRLIPQDMCNQVLHWLVNNLLPVLIYFNFCLHSLCLSGFKIFSESSWCEEAARGQGQPFLIALLFPQLRESRLIDTVSVLITHNFSVLLPRQPGEENNTLVYMQIFQSTI